MDRGRDDGGAHVRWLVAPGKSDPDIRLTARRELALPENSCLLLYEGGLEPRTLSRVVLEAAAGRFEEGFDFSVLYLGEAAGNFARQAKEAGAKAIVREIRGQHDVNLYRYSADAIVHGFQNGHLRSSGGRVVWSEGCCLVREADPALLWDAITYWLDREHCGNRLEDGAWPAAAGATRVGG